MSYLKIEVIARDRLGSIVALITSDGVVDAQAASSEIARGDATYITGPNSFGRVPVRAISAAGGPYLYANWDGSKRNNLHDLATVRVVTPPTISSVSKRPGLRERVGVLWEQFAERIGILAPLPPEATVQTENGSPLKP